MNSSSQSFHRRGATLIEVLVGIVIAILVLGAFGSLLTGCNVVRSTTGRYDITGTVTGETGNKMSFSMGENGQSGTQKFSVPLDTDGDGKMDRIVNCSSTQCGALEPGVAVLFSCYEEWHAFTPNEEECRFTSLAP